jgi:hypothetical protein
MLMRLYVAALCAVAFTATAAQAQERRMTFEQVRALVLASLPPSVGKDNTELVRNLMGAKLDTKNPLSKAFDPVKVSRAVFGRLSPNRDPACSRVLTPTGDIDPGLCTSTFGDASGTGLFSVLSYSKDMRFGDITFLKRPPLQELVPETIPQVKDDPDSLLKAYNNAVAFGIQTLGLPGIELPRPPAGIDPHLIVTTLVLGYGQEKNVGQIPLLHVVHVTRAAELPSPLPVPEGPGVPPQQPPLTHILAPGEASFLIDDAGAVQAARVEGWASLPVDPKLDPGAAKSADELADEIAQELFAGGGQEMVKVQMAFALSPSSYPNPDDPNPPLCPACQVLRPVLRVVMYTFDTKQESPAGQIAAPGLVHEFQLVDGTVQAPVRPARQ